MKYVISYLDLNTDKFFTLDFTSKKEAEVKYKEIKNDKNCISELMMSKSDYEQLESDLAENDDLYDENF